MVTKREGVEIVLLIVLCYVVWGCGVVEKLQRVACRGEVVDRNFVVLKTVDKFLNCLKLTVKFSCLLNY